MRKLFIALLIVPFVSIARKKQITLEDLQFEPDVVPGFFQQPLDSIINPTKNAKGYDENSPLNFTDRIKGKFLIIHGTADDNVHFQNGVEMINAIGRDIVDFQGACYPKKNNSISATIDNSSFHLWSKMTNWLTKSEHENAKSRK